MIEFVWPQTTGEWWAWSSAVLLVFYGIWMFVAPRWWLVFLNLEISKGQSHAIAEIRAGMGGAKIGLGLAVLVLHPQPLLYLALGAMFFFTALTRLISIFIDNAHSRYNWAAVAFEGLLAFGPLAYALGYIA